MKQALLVIDVQNDYFFGGAMPLQHPEKALSSINKLEKLFLTKDLPIIYIQHFNSPQAQLFRPNTSGVGLHARLKMHAHSIIIGKNKPNSFFNTELDTILKNLTIQQLVITGMMTHMCIDSTTRAASELGYQPIVITDATATKDLELNSRFVPAADVQIAFLSALSNFATLIDTTDFIINNEI